MSNALNAEDAPQPPKVLSTPLEISGNLRQLLDSHDPLIITFHERSQRFQSYLVDLDRERNMIALDEMIPRDGERFLLAGEPYKVEGFHEGVRIAWESNGQLRSTNPMAAVATVAPCPMRSSITSGAMHSVLP